MSFKMGTTKVNTVTIVYLNGKINNSAARVISEQIDELLKSSQNRIIMEVSKADYIDSDGLGLLNGIYEKCVENGGNMTVVCSNNPRVHQVLEITRLKEKFGVHDTVKSARVVLETVK